MIRKFLDFSNCGDWCIFPSSRIMTVWANSIQGIAFRFQAHRVIWSVDLHLSALLSGIGTHFPDDRRSIFPMFGREIPRQSANGRRRVVYLLACHWLCGIIWSTQGMRLSFPTVVAMRCCIMPIFCMFLWGWNTAMRYYVTADVHGYFDELKKALAEQGYFADTEPHKLVICGDLYDRGKQASALQAFILDLMEK